LVKITVFSRISSRLNLGILNLATKAITKAIAFYNYFLERQERYQQETAEQREAEKAWIDQQRRELERVQQGIEAILNPN